MKFLGSLIDLAKRKFMSTKHNASLKTIINSAVGPAPWYWRTFPKVTCDDRELVWRFLGTKGSLAYLVVLEEKGSHEPLLALNTYARPFLANAGYLGVWAPLKNGGDIDIQFVEIKTLSPIHGFPIAGKSFKDSSSHVLHSATIAERVSISNKLAAGLHEGPKAKCAESLHEVFIIAAGPHCESGIDSAPAASIYIWKPAIGKITVLPQRWFTAEVVDLGYEWITRVTRDSHSGHLVGGGIRIDDFVLTEDGTQLLRRL